MPTRFRYVEIRDLAKYGWAPDLPTEKLVPGAFPVVDNFRFHNGRAETVRGWTAHGATAGGGEPGLIARARTQNGSDIPIICTARRIYKAKSDGTIEQLNAQDYTSATNVRWEMAAFPDTCFFNRTDGLLQIKTFNGSTLADLTTLAGTAPKGRSMSQFKAHLLIGAITNDGNGNIDLQSVAGSDLVKLNADSGEKNWDYTSNETDALVVDCYEGNDDVQRILQFGDYLAIYKEGSIHLLNYVAGTDVYARQVVDSDTGVACQHSVIGKRGQHYFVGQDNIYRFPGTRAEPMGDAVYNSFLRTIMPADVRKLWAFDDILRKEIIWGGNGVYALVYNYETGLFSRRTWPFAAAGYVNLDADSYTFDTIPAATFDEWGGTFSDLASLNNLRILAADGNGVLYHLAETRDAVAGTADLTCRLETGALDLDLNDNWKICNGVRVDAEVTGTNPLQVYVATREHLGQALDWQGPYPVTNGKAYCWHSGRYLNFALVKVGGTASISGFAPMVRPTGRL
jgi:hypothetical protein